MKMSFSYTHGNKFNKMFSTSSVQWSLGLIATGYLAYRFTGWSKREDFKSKIHAKKEARMVNQSNLEHALLINGQVTH